MVNDKSRLLAFHFFDVLFLHIVHLYLWTSIIFGIKSSKLSGFFKDPVRKLFPVGFDNYMGSGHFFCVEPPVVPRRKRKGQLLVLEIVFPYIDIVTVAGTIMKREAFKCFLFLCELPANVATLSQFFFYLCQIVFGTGDIQALLMDSR